MLMLVAVLVGCDGHHDPLDTSMKVGHILCTDGKTRSYEDYVASGKEAIAVVFHVNRNEEMSGTGYAVYLHDLPPEAFADSLGISQGTSADLALTMGTRTPLPCMIQTMFLHLWPCRCSICGGTGKVPTCLPWHRYACSMPPRSLSIPTSRLAAATRCRMKPMNVGIGRVPRWKDRKPPRHGCSRWVAVPCRKHLSYRSIK